MKYSKIIRYNCWRVKYDKHNENDFWTKPIMKFFCNAKKSLENSPKSNHTYQCYYLPKKGHRIFGSSIWYHQNKVYLKVPYDHKYASTYLYLISINVELLIIVPTIICTIIKFKIQLLHLIFYDYMSSSL